VRGFDWRGLAAVLIVVGVFAVLLVGSIGAVVNRGRVVTTEDIATVSAVLGTAIGAVSVYLGTKARTRPRERPPARRPPRGPADPTDPPG
jgi:hypothetical protein